MKNRKMTAREAADVIGVKYHTLINWSHSGIYADSLPMHKTTGGRLYLMSKDVERFAKDYSI